MAERSRRPEPRERFSEVGYARIIAGSGSALLDRIVDGRPGEASASRMFHVKQPRERNRGGNRTEK